MRYVSAYMLAAMGAKHHHITAHDIESILGSVGVICQREKAEEVVKRMHGKTLEELIEEGAKYLSMSAVPATAAIGNSFVCHFLVSVFSVAESRS
ncbi:unnamed protein product [Gongylonema pulchrum]|uniref:Large ribosomal subunit protein P2 n=1 Tax=Gongylonema pulchrum TaxID=637853 RepID=A0A183EK89_9BILA|nr:unnamed protein product [Gongylonema pulchrum]